MGVCGLSSFVKENEELFIKGHQLQNTHLVVDALNLMHVLAEVSIEGERTDLFGGNMVAFGSTINLFFDELKICKIKPILVMDGAASLEDSKCRLSELNLSRSQVRFNNVLQINDCGFGKRFLPVSATIVFKSIAVDRGVEIRQSFSEADMEVARLARQYKCPALSDDSDFYLVDLPQGFIPISSLKWHKRKTVMATKRGKDRRKSEPGKAGKNKNNYILCDLYKQENFKNYAPNLNILCLPLLGPLVGNDFVSVDTHSKLIDSLQSNRVLEKIKYNDYIQHIKLYKLLCFFGGRTPNEVIGSLSLRLPGEERSKFRKHLKLAIDVYRPPRKNTYVAKLRKIYEAGYKLTYAERMPETLHGECKKAINSLAKWLIACAEKSVMTHKVLELLQRSVLFIKPSMGDVSLPSAQICRYRVSGVILRLLRPTKALEEPIEIYNRTGDAYEKTLLHQVCMMDEFGPIDYLAYDVPSLPQETRRDLVLSTFHFNQEKLVECLSDCETWFEPKHRDEFIVVWIIMDYIDIECKDAELTKHFRQAVMLCLVYYLCTLQPDDKFVNRMEQLDNQEFVSGLKETIKARHLSNMPVIGETPDFGTRVYECRIVHQIFQLHVSIESFNLLNAFLGDPLNRVRAECWLNSCLIYNLTEALHRGLMKVPRMPDIISRAMAPYSSD